MLCYKDREFCPVHVSSKCKHGMTCDRALDPHTEANAINWTKKIFNTAEMALISLSERLSCYEPIGDEWLCQFYPYCAHGGQCSRAANKQHLATYNSAGKKLEFPNFEPECFKYAGAVRKYGISQNPKNFIGFNDSGKVYGKSEIS